MNETPGTPGVFRFAFFFFFLPLALVLICQIANLPQKFDAWFYHKENSAEVQIAQKRPANPNKAVSPVPKVYPGGAESH